MLRKEQLHTYQLTGADHVIDNPKAGLFKEMGLGKTATTLTAINYLIYEDFEIDRVLVIAPKRVAETVWVDEIDTWEHLRHLTTSRIIGTQKQRLLALDEEADIYLIGRDNVAWLCAQFGGSSLPFDMLVIDESSSFKNPKSVRFKALRLVQPSFSRVVLLTGTPAPNGLLDIWSQIYLLDRGERLGKFLTHYREHYFRAGARNGHIVYKYNIRSNAEEAIYKKISDIVISMKTKDYLKDLKGRKNNYVKIEFSKALRKKYDEFERELVLEMIEAEDITAANAAALTNKLLQFANGAVYDADRNIHEIHKLKLEALEEIIDAAQSKPVLVFWTYRHDLIRIKKRFAKLKPVKLKGKEDIAAWNKGEIPLLLMHPASGGHGLNLQAGGNIVVWFGQTWSLELYQQANARLDRQGQKALVMIHHLILKGTLDERVLAALERKTGKQEALMHAVKSLIKKYLK